MPATRTISQAMARGFAIEELKKKKLNWAAYGEWTNGDQWRRRQKGPKGGDGGECEGFRVDERVGVSGEALCFVDLHSGMEDIEAYKEHVDELLKESEVSLQKKLKERDEISFLDVVAQKQAADRATLVEEADCKLQNLVGLLARAKQGLLDGVHSEDARGGDLAQIETDVRVHQMVLDALKTLADEGDSKFKPGLESDEDTAKQIAVLEEDVATCKQHAAAISNFLAHESTGSRFGASIVPPQPYFVDGAAALRESIFLSIDLCVFCGLGFSPTWALQFSSCQHPYHHWCATYHFARSWNCALKKCNELMHSDWWSSSGFKKPVLGGGAAKFGTLMQPRRLPSGE